MPATIFGNAAATIGLYQAFYGTAPASATFNNNLALVAQSGASALASAMGANFAKATPTALATTVLANMGISNTVLETALGQMFAAYPAAARGQIVLNLVNILPTLEGDATYGATASKWNALVTANNAYSVKPTSVSDAVVGANAFTLTAGVDNIAGTAGADTFHADLAGNGNTLESGDILAGGAGVDTLMAVLGDASNFAISANTSGIENVVIRAQSTDGNGSSSNNNIYTEQVTVDAGRMQDVTRWESSNSRASLVVEDVRSNSNKTTVAMVSTDPGHSDYGVYFAPGSIGRDDASVTGNSLTVNIANVLNVAKGANPVGGFTGFTFTADSKAITVDIKAATSYAAVKTATEAALAAAGVSDVTVALAATKDAYFSTDIETFSAGQKAGGYSPIVLTSTKSKLVVGQVDVTQGQTNSNVVNTMAETVQQVIANVTSVNITLDDVGRGSTGGDLAVGSLSVGDTSTSKGIQKFDITVERSSKLQNINSTNNSLEQVVLKNGATKGDVSILGSVSDLDATGAPSSTNSQVLPGTENQHDAYGLNDVRVVDASAMDGKVSLSAVLGSTVAKKYMDLIDTQADINADNSVFQYTLGKNNDTLTLDIDAANLNATGAAARGDFELKVVGGAGDDTITTNIVNSIDGEGNTATWYQNQKLNVAAGAKLSVDGGDGNDTIHTLGGGDFVITGGAGNDTVYTDNSGVTKEVWAFNAVTGAVNNNLVGLTLGAPDLLYKATLTVTVSGPATAGESGVIVGAATRNTIGFESTVVIPTNGYTGNQGQVNQAIKSAINNHAVLSKLLEAKDGPDNTVVVTSKVDGNFATTDIAVNLNAVSVASLSAAEKTALSAVSKTTSDAALQTYLNGVATTYETKNLNPQTVVNGVDSAAASDNTITGGAGDDVIVLSTGAHSGEAIVYSGYNNGNDTVVNFTADTLNRVVNAGVDVAGDVFDFSAYGVNSNASVLGLITQAAAGGAVTVSQGGSALVADNGIAIIRFTGTANNTFAGLTAANFLQAVNTAGDVGQDLYGELDTKALGAGNNPSSTTSEITSSAGRQNHIAMVEDAANLGVYKIFHLTSSSNNTDSEFTSSDYVGQVDIGASLGQGSTLPPVVVPPIVVPPVGNPVTILAAGAAGTAAADVFSLNAVAALADAAGTNFQSTVTGFSVAADRLTIDLPTANAAITTLAQLNGQQGVTVQVDPFTGNTLINLGNDANGGEVASVTLVGVADPALVLVQIV